MARIRTIKPTFFRSLAVAELSHRARLTWIGLWTMADDAGRCVDDPRLVKADVWPLDDDVSSADVSADLDELERTGRVVRYEACGRRYLEVTGFSDHQRINRPQPSDLPPPPPPREDALSVHGSISDRSVIDHAPRTEPSLLEGKGKERERIPPGGAASRAPTAQSLVAAWIDGCTRRPPGNVVGQVAKQVKALLDEGFSPHDVTAGLDRLRDKGLHPSTLPSLVNEVVNRPTVLRDVAWTDEQRNDPSIWSLRGAS